MAPIGKALVPVRVRMGLHTGEAEQEGADYLGDDLHRAARLMDAGHGGQVLLSLVTSELVREALRRDPTLAGVELRELGVYGLRDLERPERIFQLVAPDLRADFPALRSETPFFTNLPAELDRFVGRGEELKALCELLRGHVCLRSRAREALVKRGLLCTWQKR